LRRNFRPFNNLFWSPACIALLHPQFDEEWQ
jgi:hypothetical protein